MTGACHCGRVRLSVPGRPEYLNICNCTLCTKLGGMWGYFPRSKVTVDGETGAYVRADEAEPYLSSHFCKGCGSTTHWSPLAADAPDRMGVNMRLFDQVELAGIEVRYPDGRRGWEDGLQFYCQPTRFDGAGAVQ